MIKKSMQEREQEMVSRSGSEQVMQRTGDISSGHGKHNEVRLYEKLYLATYICDFGNVVINSVRSK